MKKKIVLTRFPFTDLSATKRRPAVVMAERLHNDVIVAFISSNVSNQTDADFFLATTDAGFTQTGLVQNSVFKMDKLATLNTAIFSGEIGEVSDNIFESLKEKLKIALDL